MEAAEEIVNNRADDDGTGAGVDGIVSIFVFMVFVIIIVESDSIWYC
jgi:hypothetical protein